MQKAKDEFEDEEEEDEEKEQIEEPEPETGPPLLTTIDQDNRKQHNLLPPPPLSLSSTSILHALYINLSLVAGSCVDPVPAKLCNTAEGGHGAQQSTVCRHLVHLHAWNALMQYGRLWAWLLGLHRLVASNPRQKVHLYVCNWNLSPGRLELWASLLEMLEL